MAPIRAHTWQVALKAATGLSKSASVSEVEQHRICNLVNGLIDRKVKKNKPNAFGSREQTINIPTTQKTRCGVEIVGSASQLVQKVG